MKQKVLIASCLLSCLPCLLGTGGVLRAQGEKKFDLLPVQTEALRIPIQKLELRSETLDDAPIISPDTMPQTSWQDVAVTDWYDENVKEVIVKTAEQLAGIAKLVSEGKFMKGFTFTLANDIDLKGRAWFPIGLKYRTPFQGTFEGAGYTIRNLYINSLVDAKTKGSGGATLLSLYDGTGLFGKCNAATIRNLHIKTARILSITKDAATMCANLQGSTMTNCTASDIKVQSAIKTEDGIKVFPVLSAFVATGVYATTIEDCIVSDADVLALAQIAGLVAMPYSNVNINRCIVYNFRGRTVSPKLSQAGGLCAASLPGPGAAPIYIRDCAVINGEVGGTELVGGLYGFGALVVVANTYCSNKVSSYGDGTKQNMIGSVVGGRQGIDFDNVLYNVDLNPDLPAEGKPVGDNPGAASSMRALETAATALSEAQLKSQETVTLLNGKRTGSMTVWHVNAAKYDGFPYPTKPKAIDEGVTTAFNPQFDVRQTPEGWILSGIRGSYHLLDLAGRLIVSGSIDGEASIRTTHLPAGVYIVRINTGAGIVVRKVIR